jgi:hypothetical protein
MASRLSDMLSPSEIHQGRRPFTNSGTLGIYNRSGIGRSQMLASNASDPAPSEYQGSETRSASCGIGLEITSRQMLSKVCVGLYLSAEFGQNHWRVLFCQGKGQDIDN